MMLARSLLAALTAVLLFAPSAPAAVTTQKAMWGPMEVGGVSQFPVYADLGVGIYQMGLRWSNVATRRPTNPRDPADPAYVWPIEVDQAIAGAAAEDIEVLLLVLGTPRWANGGREDNWAPNDPSDFADFIAAAARRYPAVRRWMIWGEPTKGANFLPLDDDNRGRPLSRRKQRGPRLYARMLDGAYRRLKEASARNIVIGGNTWTSGTIKPVNWIKYMRLPNGRRPRMDQYGHNPFGPRFPDLSRPALADGFIDFSSLDELATALDRYLPRARRDGRKLPIFISEFSLPTDHRNYQFNFFMTRAAQARYIRAALRITRRSSRIATLGYLGLYDEALRPDNQQTEWGLIDRAGVRKPAYEAFKRG